MEPIILVVESAPVPVLLHDGFLIKAVSSSFKSLFGAKGINDLKQDLKRFFSSGENLDQLMEGFTHKKALQLDLISYSKGTKSQWKVFSLPIATNQHNENIQMTWFVDNSYGDIQTSYWNLHVRMNKSTSELIMNRKKLEDSMVDLQNTHEELKQTQMQLIQSEKLASIGQLAAGVAHEINNPVGFISSNMEILQEYVGNYEKILRAIENVKIQIDQGDVVKAKVTIDELRALEKEIDLDYMMSDVNKLLEQSGRGLERIKKIVLDLRTFAREEDAENMELIKVEEVMDSILSIVQNEIKYKAELIKEYGDTPLIKGNAQRLGQVFINLLVNAAQSMEVRGKIIIKTYRRDNNLWIDVTDTGKGIDPEDMKKIFDPFFTTKPVGQGTGLGLSVSYEIVKKHGGDIQVESKVGEGTTFKVMLPIT